MYNSKFLTNVFSITFLILALVNAGTSSNQRLMAGSNYSDDGADGAGSDVSNNLSEHGSPDAGSDLSNNLSEHGSPDAGSDLGDNPSESEHGSPDTEPDADVKSESSKGRSELSDADITYLDYKDEPTIEPYIEPYIPSPSTGSLTVSSTVQSTGSQFNVARIPGIMLAIAVMVLLFGLMIGYGSYPVQPDKKSTPLIRCIPGSDLVVYVPNAKKNPILAYDLFKRISRTYRSTQLSNMEQSLKAAIERFCGSSPVQAERNKCSNLWQDTAKSFYKAPVFAYNTAANVWCPSASPNLVQQCGSRFLLPFKPADSGCEQKVQNENIMCTAASLNPVPDIIQNRYPGIKKQITQGRLNTTNIATLFTKYPQLFTCSLTNNLARINGHNCKTEPNTYVGTFTTDEIKTITRSRSGSALLHGYYKLPGWFGRTAVAQDDTFSGLAVAMGLGCSSTEIQQATQKSSSGWNLSLFR